MKKLLCFVVAAMAAGCVGSKMDSFPAGGSKDPGIRDFAEAYVKAHKGNRLVDDAGRTLKSGGPLDGIDFVLDEGNGFLSLEYYESAFILQLEMCEWMLKEGGKRFGVKLLDVNEEEMPVLGLAFYDFDAGAGRFREVEVKGQQEMLERLDLWDGNEDLFLPREGKDIRWGRNNDDEAIGWYRLQEDGSFRLEVADLYVCAYVWPSCHDDPLAHKWLWPEGIGEWEVIQKGDKRFPEHYQPKQPLWGYELDNDPVVVEKWIQTALEYGVNTFIYDWYWFSDPDGYKGPYLESALNDGFLKAPSHDKMHFYVMWANHDVVYNYWNYHKWGDKRALLFSPDVDWANYRKVVKRLITQYFPLPEYVKIDDCPVLSIFSMDNFIRSFGSMDEAAKAIQYFREEVRKAGFPDLHLQETRGGGSRMNEETIAKMQERIEKLGIDSEAMYNMGGINEDYLRYGEEALQIRAQMDEVFDVPVFPCVSIGWDDTPRYPAKGIKDVVHLNNTPEAFAGFLAQAKKFVEQHAADQPHFMMINAWNEWVEGSYLLPDQVNGFGYLQAVRDVLDGKYDD